MSWQVPNWIGTAIQSKISERTADKDRISTEGIADANRASNEQINADKNATTVMVAEMNAENLSLQRDLDWRIAEAKLDREEAIAKANRESNEAIAKARRETDLAIAETNAAAAVSGAVIRTTPLIIPLLTTSSGGDNNHNGGGMINAKPSTATEGIAEVMTAKEKADSLFPELEPTFKSVPAGISKSTKSSTLRNIFLGAGAAIVAGTLLSPGFGGGFDTNFIQEM